MFPALTATYAGVFGLIFAAMSLWVVGFRLRSGILHGDGREEQMGRRMRSHANFAEYVPFILLLTALLESDGTSSARIHGLLLPLLIVRLLHPFGMLAPVGSAMQYACRGGGTVVTFLVLIAASVQLLIRAN